MSINQFITEKVLGECWHEPITDSMPPKCTCGKILSIETGNSNYPYSDEVANLIFLHRASPCTLNRDFTTWQGFGKLWDKVKRNPTLWTKIRLDYQWEEWEVLSLEKRAEYIAKFYGWEEDRWWETATREGER